MNEPRYVPLAREAEELEERALALRRLARSMRCYKWVEIHSQNMAPCWLDSGHHGDHEPHPDIDNRWVMT